MKLGNLISKKESKHVVKQTNVQSGGQILPTGFCPKTCGISVKYI